MTKTRVSSLFDKTVCPQKELIFINYSIPELWLPTLGSRDASGQFSSLLDCLDAQQGRLAYGYASFEGRILDAEKISPARDLVVDATIWVEFMIRDPFGSVGRGTTHEVMLELSIKIQELDGCVPIRYYHRLIHLT